MGRSKGAPLPDPAPAVSPRVIIPTHQMPHPSIQLVVVVVAAVIQHQPPLAIGNLRQECGGLRGVTPAADDCVCGARAFRSSRPDRWRDVYRRVMLVVYVASIGDAIYMYGCARRTGGFGRRR